jgi:fatty-acyl-CoA synthase
VHLAVTAAAFPDRDALVVDDPSGRCRRVTYAELDVASNRLAHALREEGLRRGDAVAVVLRNADAAALFEVFWAVMRLGLYFVPVNHGARPDEIRHVLIDGPVRAVVAAPETAGGVRVAADGLPLTRLVAGARVDGFTALADFTAGRPVTMPDDAEEGQMLLYSSGTSGRPKGILRELPGLAPGEGPTQGSDLATGFDLRAGDRYLSPGPLYHSAPIAFCAAQHRVGGTAVVMTRFDAARALDLLEAEAITTSQWVPTMFVRLLDLPAEARLKARDLSAHRLAYHAAAPCPVEVKRAMIDWWGPIVTEYYSGTEGGRTKITADEWLERPGSVGRHWRGGTVHVLDRDGEAVPPGTDGLIHFEAPAAGRFRYLNQPEATAAAYAPPRPGRPDLFTLGDIGHVDVDGYLYVTDRATDLVISGGANIYPREVENALRAHPAIADVAVIGLPDRDLGERVMAVIETVPGATPPDHQDVLTFCAERIALYKCPRAVEFVDALPRSEAGKVLKRELRLRYG